MSRRLLFFVASLLLTLSVSASSARAGLSQKQTRKLITKMAGLSLGEDSVRVKSVAMNGSNAAEATAEIEVVFRLAQNEDGKWRIRQVRAGLDRWEDIDVIARAGKFRPSEGQCDGVDEAGRASSAELSAKRARCLVASLLSVGLPSDSVRIKEVSVLGLPLGSQSSALAVTLVQLDFHLVRDASGWRIVELRSGDGAWVNVEGLSAAIDAIKRSRATDELNQIAGALADFRRDQGFYVVSEKQSVLIDHLCPKYLARVLRFDPWHYPYHYQGERNRFTLRSVGPDGKPNTGDDVVVSQ